MCPRPDARRRVPGRLPFSLQEFSFENLAGWMCKNFTLKILQGDLQEFPLKILQRRFARISAENLAEGMCKNFTLKILHVGSATNSSQISCSSLKLDRFGGSMKLAWATCSEHPVLTGLI